jgi:hypothetical protein
MQDNMSFATAQADMRQAYAGGVIGILVSGTVWLLAGCVALYRTPHDAVLALLAGGVLIHPLAVLLAKATGRSGAHTRGNPLGQLSMEATVWMLLGIAIAYGVSLWRTNLFFPAMLFIIGGRYGTFATVYGMRLYWAFGAALAASGYLVAINAASMAVGAFTGGAIELVFAAVLYASLRSRETVAPAPGGSAAS